MRIKERSKTGKDLEKKRTHISESTSARPTNLSIQTLSELDDSFISSIK
jgi:hypothetical protein